MPASTLPQCRGRLGALAVAVALLAAPIARADDAIVAARLTPANMTPYAGEVVDLELEVALRGVRRGQVVGGPRWDTGGLSAEPWSEGHLVRSADGGAVQFHSRVLAPAPGRVALAPAVQAVQVESARGADRSAAMRRFGGTDMLDAFFDRFAGGMAMTDVEARSNAVQLDVQPLPLPAPPDFSGAVGQFALESRVTPDHAKTGEPVTWTLTLSGTGNWPSGVALPARAVPAGLRTLQPKQHASFGAAGRFSGERSEDLVLIPAQPGDLVLAPVRFVYFDPQLGAYQTSEARPLALHISGAAPRTVAQPAPATVATAPQDPSRAAAMPVALPGVGHGRAPLRPETLWRLAVVPLALTLCGWLAVAAWRAAAGTARLATRRARRTLRAAVLASRDAATPAARAAALLAWQRAAAAWLGLAYAAPTTAQLIARGAPGWAAVWAASERALFARSHALPDEWATQALALCAPPARSRRRAQRRRGGTRLIPQTAALALLCAGLATTARGAGVADTPLDWVARHNAGVAAAAGDLERALAEVGAAFVQAPRQPQVRATLATLVAQRGDGDRDAAVARLAADGRLAPLASPWQWQLLLLGCAALIVAGLTLASWRRAARLVAAAGLCGAAVAALALHEYGPLADPRAALLAHAVALRPLPTDAAAASDRAAPLPAGAVVLAERDFLGWARVRRADGTAGWVRQADLVSIFRVPST